MSRLETYVKIAQLHDEYMPMIRVGQFFDNLRTWMRVEHGQDMFYTDDHYLYVMAKEFVETQGVKSN